MVSILPTFAIIPYLTLHQAFELSSCPETYFAGIDTTHYNNNQNTIKYSHICWYKSFAQAIKETRKILLFFDNGDHAWAPTFILYD